MKLLLIEIIIKLDYNALVANNKDIILLIALNYTMIQINKSYY